jgi:NADH dehydrogenase FAD-containing subunit
MYTNIKNSHKIGSIRASVSNEWVKKTQIPLHSIVRYGNIIVGEAIKVNDEDKCILFADPEQPVCHYDILVAATGSISRSPGDLQPHLKSESEIADFFQKMSEAIAEAKNIVIVGGGASSIEYAGEIRDKYPEKEIKIICANSGLLASSIAPLSPKFMKHLYTALKHNHIDVVFEERVQIPSAKDFEDKKFITNVKVVTKGQKNLEFQADLVIWAASYMVDTRIYPDSWLNELGELDVRDTFQLKHRNDVFAFGDVSSLAETKQAITLPHKVEYITHNIHVVADAMKHKKYHSRSTEDKDLQRKMKAYTVSAKATFYLPVGAKDGASQAGSGFFGPKVYGSKGTSEFKGKDLYSEYFWKILTDSSAPSLT